MTRKPSHKRWPDNSPDPEGEFPIGAPEYLFYLLFHTARQRDLAFEKMLAPSGLNLVRWRSLAVIRRVENCTMSELARHSTMERTSMTRAVDQLVAEGLVDRWVPSHDRRQVNVALTDEGEQVYLKAVKVLMDFNALNLRGVAADDLRCANKVLAQVLGNLIEDPRLSEDILSFGRPGGRPGERAEKSSSKASPDRLASRRGSS